MINEADLIREEREWEQQKSLIQRKQKLEKEKKELKPKKQKKTTTKLLVFFLFLNCTIIELFTGWTVIKSLELSMLTGAYPDFSPLIALIGAVVGEVMGFGVYAVKSAKENSKGGIVYDQVINQFNNMMNSDGTVG